MGVFSLIGGGLTVLIGVFLLFTGEAAGVVVGIICGLLALIIMYFGLNLVRAGRARGAVAGTEGSDIDHLMGAIQNLGQRNVIAPRRASRGEPGLVRQRGGADGS